MLLKQTKETKEMMEKTLNILFINACIRTESRTLVLAKDILSRMNGEITELNLIKEKIFPLDSESLAKREALLQAGNYDDLMLGYAKQFAEADEIVIAAPFWDLSFPSILKIYMEQVTVAGITFAYRNGVPQGLCKAKRLVYITTSGGEIFCDFGYTYIKSLANNFYGIKDTEAFRAMNLDVLGITAETLLDEATVSAVK